MELGTSGTVSSSHAAAVAKLHVEVLIIDTSRNATSASWIQPYISAGVATDYVTYSAAQDAQIPQFKFSRVLSGDILMSKHIAHCA